MSDDESPDDLPDLSDLTQAFDEDLYIHPVAHQPARHPPHHYKVTRRGRWVRRGLVTVVSGFLLLILAGVGFYFYAEHRLASTAITCSTCQSPTSSASNASFNILVLGSDTRSVLSKADQQLYDPTGVDQSSGQRSDTIVLVHVIPATGKAVAVSLPRDLRVPTADGKGWTKINSFYNNGPNAMVTAVSAFTGLPINHYIEVNFDSFRTITDALGGVDVHFSQRIVDPNSGLNQPAGCDHLTGNQALAFVRDRDTDSDFGRIARQQLFIRLMMGKVLTPGTLLNPAKVLNLINLGFGAVTHDSGLTLGMLTSLAVHYHSFSASDIDFRVVPSAPETIGGGDYVVQNQAQTAALFGAIGKDSPLPDYGKQGVSAMEPSQVSVTLLNGTNTAGLAARAGNALTAKGYDVISTGNPDNHNYTKTVVYYTPGNQSRAQFLQGAMFPSAEVQALPSTITVTSGDAVVVLGTDDTLGASPSPGASGGPSPTPSPTALLPAGPAEQIMTSVPDFSGC